MACSQQEWNRAARRIDERVHAAVKAAGHRRMRVDYAAYKSDKNDVPIDNLDRVAARGKVRLVCRAEPFYGGPRARDYRSEILDSPTWLEAAVCANDMIRVTRDGHHVFLEGLTRLPKVKQVEPGVTLYEFVMGS